jgi:hypothetical protein
VRHDVEGLLLVGVAGKPADRQLELILSDQFLAELTDKPSSGSINAIELKNFVHN